MQCNFYSLEYLVPKTLIFTCIPYLIPLQKNTNFKNYQHSLFTSLRDRRHFCSSAFRMFRFGWRCQKKHFLALSYCGWRLVLNCGSVRTVTRTVASQGSTDWTWGQGLIWACESSSSAFHHFLSSYTWFPCSFFSTFLHLCIYLQPADLPALPSSPRIRLFLIWSEKNASLPPWQCWLFSWRWISLRCMFVHLNKLVGSCVSWRMHWQLIMVSTALCVCVCMLNTHHCVTLQLLNMCVFKMKKICAFMKHAFLHQLTNRDLNEKSGEGAV